MGVEVWEGRNTPLERGIGCEFFMGQTRGCKGRTELASKGLGRRETIKDRECMGRFYKECTRVGMDGRALVKLDPGLLG